MAGPSYSKTYQDVCGATVTENYFTPDFSNPGTLNWAFTKFSAGAQYVISQNSKIELFWDAEGNASNLILIDAIYTTGETYQHDLDPNITYPYTPNVSRVLVRRTCMTAGSGIVNREIYAQWQGTVV